MLLLLLPAGYRRLRGRLRWGRLLMWLLVIFAGAFALNGCGGGGGGGSTGPTVQKTPPGSYTVTVSATSGGVSHSTNVTLVVQ
jgi:drug/metabolite transporter (DMT)-like permease